METKSERMRRIIEYGTKRHHGDQDIAPQCMMWLRRTRPDFPSLQELALDLQRQEQMKVLAQQADERWKKGSLLRNEGLTPEQQQRLASITGGLHQQDIKHQEEDRAKATSVPVLETPIQLANINPRR